MMLLMMSTLDDHLWMQTKLLLGWRFGNIVATCTKPNDGNVTFSWWFAMKVCDNNRLPRCDDGDFEGFHPWITFVKDDSRAPLKGEWFTKLFKLKMHCCSSMHWKFPYHRNGKNFKMAIVGMSMEITFAFFWIEFVRKLLKLPFSSATNKSKHNEHLARFYLDFDFGVLQLKMKVKIVVQQ